MQNFSGTMGISFPMQFTKTNQQKQYTGLQQIHHFIYQMLFSLKIHQHGLKALRKIFITPNIFCWRLSINIRD